MYVESLISVFIITVRLVALIVFRTPSVGRNKAGLFGTRFRCRVLGGERIYSVKISSAGEKFPGNPLVKLLEYYLFRRLLNQLVLHFRVKWVLPQYRNRYQKMACRIRTPKL